MTSDDSHCCYLLRSLSTTPNHVIKSYIGCIGDHSNRLRQHNGEVTGGANETQSGGPWEFVAIVKGFPDKDAALAFESAWKNPATSLLIRNSIGDRETDLLGEQMGSSGELAGTNGHLAVLKCLLNDCERFTPFDLCVVFSTKEWRMKFLKAKYIFDCGDDGFEDGQDGYSIVPSLVDTTLKTSASSAKTTESSDQQFRWEMLPDQEEINSIRNTEQLSPKMWRKIQRVSMAIHRADKRDPFRDEWTNNILLAREYELMNQIAECTRFMDCHLALRKAIACFGAEDGNVDLDRLREVSAQFDGYAQKFDNYCVNNMRGHQNVQNNIENCIQREENLMFSRAPKPFLIADFLHKVNASRGVIPRPIASGNWARRGNEANTQNGTILTEEQEDAIAGGVQQHGMHGDEIKNSFPGIVRDISTEPIGNKVKNMQQKRTSKVSFNQGCERKKRREFDRDEDNAILNGVERYQDKGFLWKLILEDQEYGAKLSGRSAEGIRKRYEKVLKNRPLGLRVL